VEPAVSALDRCFFEGRFPGIVGLAPPAGWASRRPDQISATTDAGTQGCSGVWPEAHLWSQPSPLSDHEHGAIREGASLSDPERVRKRRVFLASRLLASDNEKPQLSRTRPRCSEKQRNWLAARMTAAEEVVTIIFDPEGMVESMRADSGDHLAGGSRRSHFSPRRPTGRGRRGLFRRAAGPVCQVSREKPRILCTGANVIWTAPLLRYHPVLRW